MRNLALVMVWFLAAACGGKQGGGTISPPAGSPAGDGGEPSEPTDNTAMVSADTVDEIARLFQRKANAVSRCLAIVVDNKELPKNSRGQITLEVTISPGGKPEQVKILSATLDSKPLHDCVIERVKEIQFPPLPNTYPTTHSYAFEAT